MFDILLEEAGTTELASGENFHQAVVETGIKLFENDFKERYPKMENMFASTDARENYVGGLTCMVMKSQERFLESMKKRYSESVITSKLGDLAPRIMDVVRIGLN